MIHNGEWFEDSRYNEWNDTTTVLHRRQINEAQDWHRAYLQIQELDGRWYWSSNVLVSFDPKLSKLAYGMLETKDHTLEDAKRTAEETAEQILRTAEEKRAARLALR